MKLKLLAGAAFAAAVAATGASAAEPGWYGAVDLGYHWQKPLRADGSANNTDGAPYRYDFDTDADWAGFARLGYRVAPNWRVELEGGYRTGGIDTIRGRADRPQPIALCSVGVGGTSGYNCPAPDGDIDSWTLMGNVLYDFFPDSAFNVFVGAGVGVNRVDVNVTGQFNTVPGTTLTIDDDDVTFAYQGIAGVSWAATEKLNVDLTYRYLGGSDVDFASTSSGVPAPGTFSGEYEDQSVTIGLRYSFASPPPPPPPAAPEAKEFIVYFPFDQYVLTPEAQTVVQEAAQYATSGNATKVVVVGHTDTSGSDAYNARLSERRGKAVADALVGLGVGQSTLSVDWKGETAPAVATGDGVKEPLNRRSTISINF